MLNADKPLFYFGILLFRIGMFFPLKALPYIDLLMKIFPTPYEANNVKIIGKNKLTFEVVSSIITAKEYVSLVDPDKTAVAPKIQNVSSFITSPPVPNIKVWRGYIRCPRAQPIRIPGRNIPLGTAVPDVRKVNTTHEQKNIRTLT